jgi:RNA polymerase sigma-70 factor (ECF subfamily)
MDTKNSLAKDFLANQFQANRAHLGAVAYRMLGSRAEAEDAVQEAWLRVDRAGTDGVQNLSGWMTTILARICLDMLRARKTRREEPVSLAEAVAEAHADPFRERELADSVGTALLVVLQALEPAERIAFVLHDMFDLPFEQIAPIVGRSNDATRQLASRARKRVRGIPRDENVSAGRTVVEAFLAASRDGDFQGLLAVLDPQVVARCDAAAAALGAPRHIEGAMELATMFRGRAQTARAILIDGRVGIAVAPMGRLLLALDVAIRDGRIAAMDVIGDPVRLAGFTFALLPD